MSFARESIDNIRIEELSSCPLRHNYEYTSMEALDSVTNPEQYTSLYCYNKSITSLKIFHRFVNVDTIVCDVNDLTNLDGIESFPNLILFYCNNNKINSLVGLSACTKLENLECARNKLMTLDGINNPNLWSIDCSENNLKSIQGIEHSTYLHKFICTNTNIESIIPLSNCTRLQILQLSNNKLTSLNGLEQCHMIDYIHFENNHVTSLSPIYHLDLILDINMDNNAIAYEEQTMFVAKIRQNQAGFHVTKMNYLVRDVLEQLLEEADIEDSVMSQPLNISIDTLPSQIRENCLDSQVHSFFNVTYLQAFRLVYNKMNSYGVDMIGMLNNEISTSLTNSIIKLVCMIYAIFQFTDGYVLTITEDYNTKLVYNDDGTCVSKRDFGCEEQLFDPTIEYDIGLIAI